MNRMWLKLTDILRSENGGFSIVCEKCHVCDVTLGGASVVSTSGFWFPVGHDLNRSTCSGEFLVVAYFRCERCSKVGNKLCYFSFLQGSVPLGLAGAVAFFSIAENNKRWGKRRWFAQLFPIKVNYCKFNNFGTACRIGSIFEGKVGEVNPDVPRVRPRPLPVQKF